MNKVKEKSPFRGFGLIALKWLVVVFTVFSASGVYAQVLSDSIAEGAALELSPGVSGEVSEVLVNVGENVQQGKLLLRLDTTQLHAMKDQAAADMAYHQEKHKLAKQHYDRQQELYDEGSLSTVELEMVGLEVTAAAADLARANAASITAKWMLSQAEIRAPFDGEIIAVAAPGQRVNLATSQGVLIKMRVE